MAEPQLLTLDEIAAKNPPPSVGFSSPERIATSPNPKTKHEAQEEEEENNKLRNPGEISRAFIYVREKGDLRRGEEKRSLFEKDFALGWTSTKAGDVFPYLRTKGRDAVELTRDPAEKRMLK